MKTILTLFLALAMTASADMITYADGITAVFNPSSTLAGINVGAVAGNPSTLVNGDLWYDSTANALKARINGATVSLGSGSVDEAADYAWTGAQDFTGSTMTLPTITTLTTTTTNATTLAIGGTTITATGAELNILDGVTATAAELNYVDGVTSNVQTQLNAKVTTGAETDAFVIAISDETTALTTGTAKVTFRAPYACTITGVRASLTTVSSSGTPTFDINETGTTVLSTKLTVDASEKTSTTAAAAAVVSDAAIADDAEITIDIDTAGTGAAGAKITIIHTH